MRCIIFMQLAWFDGGEILINLLVKKCIDINSEYCPCLLAETNNCTFCSKLQGEESCNCNWQGVCIFYEKHWQDKLPSVKRKAERITLETEVLSQEQIGDKTYQVKFNVAAALAEQLAEPGAFVFLRRLDDSLYCHFPVGIMKIDGNEVTVAIEAIGAKSSRFILNKEAKIVVKAPYYNGVLGKPWLDNLQDGNVVVIAGGIGQAPALPMIKKLLANNNTISLIAAPGKTGEIFIAEAIKKLPLHFQPVVSLRNDGFRALEELLQKPVDLLVSAGPDAQHSGIIRKMCEWNVNLPMVATNNATMCCGEGICGSCEKLTQGNKKVKMCKAQIDYLQIMQE